LFQLSWRMKGWLLLVLYITAVGYVQRSMECCLMLLWLLLYCYCFQVDQISDQGWYFCYWGMFQFCIPLDPPDRTNDIRRRIPCHERVSRVVRCRHWSSITTDSLNQTHLSKGVLRKFVSQFLTALSTCLQVSEFQ
jgi:hypothetical protein